MIYVSVQQVPVAVVLSYFLLGERLTYLDYIGGALIIVGLSLVVYSNWFTEKLHKRFLASLTLDRSEEGRQALLSSEPLLNTLIDDELDSALAAGNIQQH